MNNSYQDIRCSTVRNIPPTHVHSCVCGRHSELPMGSPAEEDGGATGYSHRVPSHAIFVFILRAHVVKTKNGALDVLQIGGGKRLDDMMPRQCASHLGKKVAATLHISLYIPEGSCTEILENENRNVLQEKMSKRFCNGTGQAFISR